ncbi:hypothetical protein HO173_012532 [Letharia columbiana]|uniref:Oxidoreductase AflY n=1 Tax=Letharia columbiana TaxID=112416 RepID=A0A8H6FEZ6_9LECA|nr:uncharacterized protein HO173_012532 [Letharia columbiana]KAF6226042.1 hypothetical protein HO173_012532 [Letharia columbiana]
MSASASQVKLSPDHCGIFHLPGVTKESAAKASDVLQEDLENHHCFFNASGFHNHIPHHILTLYALGAGPELIQKHYESNKQYQRPLQPITDSILEDLHDNEKFREYLGSGRYYHEWLVFFQGEIDKKGYEVVINEYCLKGDERADDMLVRLHGGFLHPMIHLGFGVEFKQPAIVAEALAQAAVHESWLGPFMLDAEKAATSTGKGKPMVELLDEVRANKKLSEAAQWDDSNKIRDGILVRAPDEMISIAKEWKVMPGAVIEKTGEMTNAAVYYTGGAQYPPKPIKFDFYYMHCVNCSIFYDAFSKQATWITDENKARLLEWKGRLDLCMYASRRSPKPRMDIINDYEPKHPETAKDTVVEKDSWDGIVTRVLHLDDDGHAAKLVRALAHAENICAAYSMNDPLFRIKGDMWLQLGHMAIDSVEGAENTGGAWVRSAGFPQAWEQFEDHPRAQV